MSKARSAARRLRRRIGRWAAPGVHAELRNTRLELKAARKELRAQRRRTPAEQPLPDAVEAAIARARAEHLTYLSEEHLRRLAAVVADAERRRLPGLIVEAGTARGGSAIVMATAKSRERPMKVYDVFGMIPPPGERDGADVHERYARIAGGEARGVGAETYYGYREGLYDEVRDSFRRLGVPVEACNVELIRGLFEDTVHLDEPVAVAHLDGDWYESTLTCLERIAPLVVPGGRIVLDDYYKWSGCRRAVDEYFADHDGFRLEHGKRLHVVREPERTAARRSPSRAQPVLRALERGRPLDDAVLAGVRALVRDGDDDRAQSIARSLRSHPETEALGRAAAGVAAFRRGFDELAWQELRTLPRETWARLAPTEYVRSGLVLAPGEALEAIRALVAEDPPEVPAKSWYDVLGPVLGSGAHDLARAVYEVFDRHMGEDATPWRDGEPLRDWIAPWVRADPASPSAPAPGGGRPAFAIMDYGHPSARKASANIGDHVQSIAALGHLVRHEGVRFHGREEVVDLLTDLQGRTRPERRRDGVDADLEVLTVHRDASTYQAIPEGTWVLCFGWYMHALFGMRHDFPLHRNLRPLFVSFHCNKRELLTPDAVAYLERHGPVGCRDWTTVYLLSSLGVPAFFSGCVTTTIDTVFPGVAAPPAGAPLAAVDVPAGGAPAGAVAYEHSSTEVRTRSFTENVRVALDLIETYRSRHRGVVTSRLHCYLPVRSLGVPVDFRPANRADVRYDGLVDIGDDEFDAIRDGLNAKLEQVFAAILAGRPEEDVYALWRELTAADVAAADERRLRPPLLPAPADVAGRVERARSRVAQQGPDGDPVHCAVVLDRHGEAGLAALAASLLERASRPLHLWVLAQPGTEAIESRLRSGFAGASIGWVPVRGLARGLHTPSGERVRAAGVVRLLLADLLAGVERVVVLPAGAVATADVAELAGLDLQGHALAAPRRAGRRELSGFGVLHAAAERLDTRTQLAAELRRTAHARHRFDFDAFTDEVLVLDLERWRREGLGAHGVALIEAFGLTDLEALHFLAGPRHATVPARWAHLPGRTPYDGPGLLLDAQPAVRPDGEARSARRSSATSPAA